MSKIQKILSFIMVLALVALAIGLFGLINSQTYYQMEVNELKRKNIELENRINLLETDLLKMNKKSETLDKNYE
jgi:hypothetical protein